MPVPLLTLVVYVTAALCWSGSWTAGKLGVGAVPPIELSAIRFAIAGLLMLAIARATSSSHGLVRWRLLLVTGASGSSPATPSSSSVSPSARRLVGDLLMVGGAAYWSV